LWTKDVIISQLGIERVVKAAVRNRDRAHQTLKQRRIERIQLAETQANTLFDSVPANTNNSLIAAAMLYQCEGMKSDNGIAFVNSDPKLIRAFITMLVSVFNIDKLRIRIKPYLHDYHNEVEVRQFWSDELGIPLSQFTKTYHKKSNHAFVKENYKGCIRVTYYDSHIARVLQAFAKKFISLYS